MPLERVVTVRHIPEKLAGRQIADFLAEIRMCAEIDRPCVVLECSKLTHVDKKIVLLLLNCLEAAMKRNGDVRLAGMPTRAKAALKAADADALFSFFETAADAAASFRRSSISASLHVSSQNTGESAA